jgi:hypothetical protein
MDPTCSAHELLEALGVTDLRDVNSFTSHAKYGGVRVVVKHWTRFVTVNSYPDVYGERVLTAAQPEVFVAGLDNHRMFRGWRVRVWL